MKPDILDLGNFELYEIKSRGDASIGVLKMVMYITWYEQERGQADPPIVMGTTYKAPPTVPVSNGRLAHVQQNVSVPGLIFYDLYGCTDCKELADRLAPYTLTSAEMALLLLLIAAGLIIEGVLVVDIGPGDELAFGGVLAHWIRLFLAGLVGPGRVLPA